MVLQTQALTNIAWTEDLNKLVAPDLLHFRCCPGGLYAEVPAPFNSLLSGPPSHNGPIRKNRAAHSTVTLRSIRSAFGSLLVVCAGSRYCALASLSFCRGPCWCARVSVQVLF